MTFIERCGAVDVGGGQCALALGHAGEHQLSAATGPSTQEGVAGGLLELEKLRAKLIPFRIVGLIAGLALWWFVVGPALGGNPITTLIALVVLAGGGVYLGNIIGLSVLRR